MTPECPKGPERGARLEESLLAQVVEQFRVKWGYAEANELIKRYARDAIEVLSPELKRLTAEVERLRTENAKRHGQMVRVHNALTWGEVSSDFVPPCGYDDLMDKAGDIVSVLMAKVADSRNTAASMEAQRNEAQAEVSRLREQLAAQTLLPDNAEVLISQWLLDHNGTTYADYHETRPAARDLISFVLQWGIHYAEVESSTQEQAPIVHTVLLSSDTGVMGEWQAFCSGCEQRSVGDLAHAEFWKDQHLADILVPTKSPNLQANQHDEGRPSGSTATPRSGVELIAAERARQVDVEGWTPEHDAEHDNDSLARAAACYALPRRWRDPLFAEAPCPPKLWPWDAHYWKPIPADRVRELVKAGALLAAEIDRIQAQDAAQAARSEATPRGPSRCIVCGKSAEKHATPQWCMSEQYVDGSWPSPSLRKEGEDK